MQISQLEKQNHLNTCLECFVTKVLKGEWYRNQSKPALHPKYGSSVIIDLPNAEQGSVGYYIT